MSSGRPHAIQAAHDQAVADAAQQAEVTGTPKQGKPMARVLIRPFGSGARGLIPFTAFGRVAEELTATLIGTPLRVTGAVRPWQPAGKSAWYVDLHVVAVGSV
jgi:hypothetical protein